MRILSADTSTDVNTVAVLSDNELLGEISINAGKRHSERLVPLIDTLLTEVQLSIDDIHLLAISIGPGSFTGLRVGLSTWKGIALAKGLPLIGVPSLDAMTLLAPFYNTVVCPILDARMKEIFAGIYRFEGSQRKTICENFLGSIHNFIKLLKECKNTETIIFLGEGASLYQQILAENFPQSKFGECWWSHPRASAVGIEALSLWQKGYKKEVDEILPIYLRLSQPEEKRKKCLNPMT
ncbi:MAG TPA: tRNA (adenosine(37)-N6)-threonylcarbamoyltransferase complex dimerization subunit type 1 TsaB [Candidatus Hydrogenedens sp.]|nr:tRNA (adenosine(37)-N6)-threonylcarbamoyltransferase complex dimerization subunit type 1 TsaB [Candidatus Hydrogenedens sp.]